MAGTLNSISTHPLECVEPSLVLRIHDTIFTRFCDSGAGRILCVVSPDRNLEQLVVQKVNEGVIILMDTSGFFLSSREQGSVYVQDRELY